MQLFTLFFGKSKKKMHPIMTDEYHKCENYQKSREHTVKGWHEIKLADDKSKQWRKKTATVAGSRHDTSNCRGGYISKNGFNPNT